MKERNGSVAREKDCAACGGYDILPTTRRQQKVIGYMKKMTATIGLAAAIMPPAAPAAGPAGSATNSFVVVEAEGVRAAGDGSLHFANATSSVPVRVVARDGWRVEGRKSVSFVRTAGQSGSFRVRSVLGEDEEEITHHDCEFGSNTATNHVSAPVVRAVPAMERMVAMYALPQTNALVSASASLEVVTNGVHEIVMTWLPCPGCGSVHDPEVETWTEAVHPGPGSWTSTACGVSTNSNVWTGFMRKGNARGISFEVVSSNSCSGCTCSASAATLVDVHELSVANGPYVGLDRTDAGRTNPVVRTASASISPSPLFPASYSWTECGICSFTGRTDQAAVQYFAPDPDVASASYLAERLTVAATVTNECGSTASATCTTNFTVVKVDVAIGGVGEDKEETEGAFVQYVADATNGVISVEGTNKMIAVTFSCEPTDLPTNETVSITAPEGALYARLNGKYYAMPGEFDFPAHSLTNVAFFLHGHDESSTMTDKVVTVTHRTSGARDRAKYTAVSLEIIKDEKTLDPYMPEVVVVGESVDLSICARPTPLEIDECSWTIPGYRIKHWIASDNSASEENLTDEDLSQGRVHFHWVDANDGRQIIVAAEINGIRIAQAAVFDVKRPGASIQISVGTTAIDSAWGDLELHCGTPDRPGVRFSCQLSLPDGFGGRAEWIQIADPSRRKKRYTNEWLEWNGRGLDTTVPYGVGDLVDDSPGTSLISSVHEVIVSDAFEMYLMFRPDSRGAIPVPLKCITWHWGGHAIRNGEDWDLQSHENPIPVVSDTIQYPAWSRNAMSNQWINVRDMK